MPDKIYALMHASGLPPHAHAGVRILDWSNTKFSLNASGSVRRFIHLKHEDAHALMYTLLQHPLVYNGRTHGGARSGMI